MAKKDTAPDLSDVEQRRGSFTSRRMTLWRRFVHAVGKQLLRLVLFLLTSSYRFERIVGADVVERLVGDKGRAYVPVMWHGQQIATTYLVRGWIRRGFRAGYIISASVDGEVPAQIAKSWGAEVVRGSAKESASLALRDAVRLMKEGVSIVTNSDGPTGPAFEVKTGTIIMARMGSAPLVPVVCAASSAWTMDTWDHFMVPKPFARIAIAVGEPIEIPRNLPMSETENLRQQLQAAMDSLATAAQQQLS